jgi:phosphoesterase RecJ-like protein
MGIDWERFVAIVRGHERFVLTSHMRADCDALGSELGMAGVLEALGKSVVIVNGDVVPPHISFIDPQRRVRVLGRDVSPAELHSRDAFMVLDTSAWAQLGPMADELRAFRGTKILLDHHVSQDDLAAETFKDPTAEATGRLVVEAAQALGVELTWQMAFPLFAAIATDTGWFRFSSVTGETFSAAARLVAAGAVPSQIFAELYERNSLARVRLHGRILDRAEISCGGVAIHSTATADDFRATGAELTDTEDVVNRLLTVAGVKCAAIFVEISSEKTKASLRGRDGVDVRAVAEQFGGGGHTQAAGIIIAGPLAAAKSVVLDAIQKALK